MAGKWNFTDTVHITCCHTCHSLTLVQYFVYSYVFLYISTMLWFQHCNRSDLDDLIAALKHSVDCFRRIEQQFPVKLTEPLSPLLYITYDKEHMDNLKHSIHVKEINVGR